MPATAFMRARAAGFYASRCTIEEPARTQDTNGEWLDGWTATYTNQPCWVRAVPVAEQVRVDGHIVAAGQVYIDLAPTVVVTPKARITIGANVYQVKSVPTSDATLRVQLRVLAERLQV